jgi:endonuclease III-like uncharacterized protein
MTESLNRKRQIEELKLIDMKSLNPYRDQVIDEIADAVLKMDGFGKDTLDSFVVYIRSLK